MVCASIAFFVKEERLIRYISVLIAISFFSFGVYQGSIASIVSDGCTFISIVIAMIRYRGIKKYEMETTKPIDKREKHLSDDEGFTEQNCVTKEI